MNWLYETGFMRWFWWTGLAILLFWPLSLLLDPSAGTPPAVDLLTAPFVAREPRGTVNRALSAWKELTAPRPVERSGIPASGV